MFNFLLDLIYKFIDFNTTFKVKLLHAFAEIPKKADIGSAGYDLYCCEECIIEKGERKLVRTGISIEIPNYYYLRIAPRSGLSCKGIDIGAGVVDSSYRGEVKVLVINNTNENYSIKPGDKIAQFIMERCSNSKIESSYELSNTDRGENGFGSTGNYLI